MTTFKFTATERETLIAAVLQLMENETEALKLVSSKQARDAIKKEQEENKKLLDKLCFSGRLD